MKLDGVTIYLLGIIAIIIGVTIFAEWDRRHSKSRRK